MLPKISSKNKRTNNDVHNKLYNVHGTDHGIVEVAR